MFGDTVELLGGRYSIIVQTCVAVFVPLILGGEVKQGRAAGDVVVDKVDALGGYAGLLIGTCRESASYEAAGSFDLCTGSSDFYLLFEMERRVSTGQASPHTPEKVLERHSV